MLRPEARKLPAEERKQKKKAKWMAENEPTVQAITCYSNHARHAHLDQWRTK